MEKPSAYQGEEPYVFVCYAHEDAASVYPEIAWLQAEGVNVWYDEGIGLGSEWTEALANAIQGCTKFLFFVTPNAVEREHCRRELNFAQEDGLDVMAVHLQPTEVTGGLRLSLNNRQAIFKYDLAEPQYRHALLDAIGTADGSQPQNVAGQTSSTSPRWAAYAVVGLLIVVAGAWWLRAPPVEPPPSASDEEVESVEEAALAPLHNSIAVLPFDNLSPNPDDAYFAAGIHEEVLNQLAKIKDLSVIARTTVLRYAGSGKSIPEIGAELNVSAVMEGSVRYSGNRVRITAQVIDSESGLHLWSEAYEEELKDIFGIQLAIATRIADTLGAEFSLGERERIGNRATKSVEAYAHYLRALAGMMNLANIAPVHEALDAAILLDPNFGPALAFKAWLYVVEASQGHIFVGRGFTAEDQYQRINLAKHFADRALEIDDQLARAHLARAFINYHDRRWQSAADEMDRAYDLDPSDYLVANGKAWSSFWRGSDVTLALEYLDQAIELNPADAANIWNGGELLYGAQQWEAARSRANLVIRLLPQLGLGYAQLALVSSRLGDLEAAHRYAQLAESRNPGLYEYQAIARAYGQLGELEQATRIFELAGAGNDSDIPEPSWQFWMHMAVEDYASAIGYLERVVDENFRFGAVMELHTSSDHPDFNPIRSHPKFDELVRKAGLPID